MTALMNSRPTEVHASTRAGTPFAGTGQLLRLAVRTERIATPVGVLVVPALLLLTAASLAPLYPDAASRAELANGSAANPVFRILLGPLRDTSGTGPITVWRVGMFALLVVAIIVAATVTRNLRAPESTGRMELVRAGGIGSSAPLAAATITATVAAIATGVLTGVATALIGLDGSAAALTGVQFAGAGLAATGIALVVDQIVTASRTAIATSAGLLLTAYIVRGVADAVNGLSWLSWVSPLGWAERVDPLGDPSVLPIGACLLLFVVGVAAAAAVTAKRDLGAGLVEPRPGPPTAKWPVSIFGVSVRTMGSALAPWFSGAFAYCLLVGLLTNSVDDLVGGSGGTSDVIKDIGGGSSAASIDLVGALVNTVLGIVAIAAAAAGVSVAAQLRDDDRKGRAEILLATAVSTRGRVLAAAVLAAVAGALIVLLAGAGVVAGTAIVGGAGPGVGDVVISALSQLAPSYAVAAIAFAAYGFGSKWVVVGWIAVVADLLLGPLGTLIGAPQWLRDIAPHAQVPVLVGASVPVAPTIVLIVVTIALVSAGLWAVRRRDLA